MWYLYKVKEVKKTIKNLFSHSLSPHFDELIRYQIQQTKKVHYSEYQPKVD